MAKAKKPSESRKLGVIFTLKQIEILEKIVSEGKFGNNKADAIKGIIMLYFAENHLLD
ncbi:MAG: hypothetical protein WD717_07750 [Nitrosarchaeum sp.]